MSSIVADEDQSMADVPIGDAGANGGKSADRTSDNGYFELDDNRIRIVSKVGRLRVGIAHRTPSSLAPAIQQHPLNSRMRTTHSATR